MNFFEKGTITGICDRNKVKKLTLKLFAYNYNPSLYCMSPTKLGEGALN